MHALLLLFSKRTTQELRPGSRDPRTVLPFLVTTNSRGSLNAGEVPDRRELCQDVPLAREGTTKGAFL